MFSSIWECHARGVDMNLWWASGRGFQWAVWEPLLLHILCCCRSGRRWNFCHFYGTTQQGVNEVWNKNSHPTQCTDRKKIQCFILAAVIFAVISALCSARMLPNFHNLRSKEKWFLVRSPPFSVFPPTCYCMSKLVMQSRAGVRWKDWQEDPVLKEIVWVSRHSLWWTSG